MLDSILKWSIAQRWLVLMASILITAWGLFTLTKMPLDVFPAFAPPEVQIQTEAPGLAPEEVESLITRPLESAINGIPGVETVRSSSGAGISVVRVIFNWDTNIYLARQLVNERLQTVQNQLPESAEIPQISPITSPIGTILSYAFTTSGDNGTDLMELRRIVDWQVKNRLLSVPGVTQILVYGGDLRQYQVLVDPNKLQSYQISLQEVVEATEKANANAPGGFLLTPDREMLIRGMGRIESIEQLKKSVITARDGVPILLEQVADVKIGAELKRGDASFDEERAIVIMIDKQPQADTPTVTKDVETAMEEIKASLPPDVIVTTTFRQENFIEAAIKNVEESLRDGIIIVSVVLILFLMNWRTTIISLSAIPLSLLICMIILHWTGQGINTMTLGGLVVAIGSVVDDAIVDMENGYRRLQENQRAGTPINPLQVVFTSSVEVRVSVLLSTVIIVVVFAPIFALSGVEGRIFTPMGVSYLLSICASTFVAVTLTPALCALLLTKCRLPDQETWIARQSERIYAPLLNFAFRFPKIILLIALASFVAAAVIFPNLGKAFLPEFQERSLINAYALYPGLSLETTNQAGLTLQENLKDDPRFDSIQMRSGRTAGDADAGSVTLGHIDVELSDEGMKDREASIEKLREEFAKLPGVAPSVGGFISHRMDEVLSGVRSAIAVKIYGPELDQLRAIGQQVESVMKTIPGLVDLQLEPQIPLKQVQIKFDRNAAARYGLQIGDLAETIETALNGRTVSQVLEQQQVFDMIVWLQESARNNLETIGNLLVDTPEGLKIPLSQVAQVEYGTGPNTINRENVSRLIIVSSNVQGRDLGSAIADIRQAIKQEVQLPAGYYISFGGQFEAQEKASQTLLVAGILSLVVVTVLMYYSIKSIPSTIIIMVNLPLALVGGVFSVALGGGVISVASMVGFITLFGIATRNGLLLVDNYNTKLAEGIPYKQVIIEGSKERLVAILMTAFTSALGMLPLAIGSGSGKEILQPLAVVVLGGLFTSTALTLLVIPALYSQFGRFLAPKKPQEEFQKQEFAEETLTAISK
jgi:CzcA family heavy metal efflux pump